MTRIDGSKPPTLDISIVIPVYNETENVKALYLEIKTALKNIDKSFEIVFVDDGSSDNSHEILTALHQEDPAVVVIRFRRNFGQTAAMAAGFNEARGSIIITMDADLQNDPNDIPKLLEKMEEGFDLVSGWRFDRQDHFVSRRLPSIIANKVISTATNVNLHDYGCTLKAFRKEVTDGINLYGEMHRFIPAIASGMGVKLAEIKVNHRPRRFGKSKYGISRTIRVLLDLITVKFLLSYATRPLHIFGVVGFMSGLLGFIMASYLTVERLVFKMPIANRPLLLLAIMLIFIGLQFVTMGLLAEIQVRIYHESQNKQTYTIRDILRR